MLQAQRRVPPARYAGRANRQQPAGFGYRHADQPDVPRWFLADAGGDLPAVPPLSGLVSGVGAGVWTESGPPGAGLPGGWAVTGCNLQRHYVSHRHRGQIWPART